MKIIILFIILLIILPVNAMTWQHQKRIAKEIGREHDYDGGFRFKYYGESRGDYVALYKYHKSSCRYKGLITFYKESLTWNEMQFKWLVLHEIGHYKEQQIKCKQNDYTLSEEYANRYAYKMMNNK